MKAAVLVVVALVLAASGQASPPWRDARPGDPPQPFRWTDLSRSERAILEQALRMSSSGPSVHGQALAPPASGPAVFDDRVIISKDDDFVAAPQFGYEGRLSPTAGAAGPADHAAFRFATGDIARLLPVTVPSLIVGFDSRLGRTTWPLIGLARESRTTLLPDLATLSPVTGFALPLGLPAPPADAFQRFPVPLNGGAGVVIDRDYFDDGGLSDDFDRTDEAFGTPPWLECTLTTCPGSGRLRLVGNHATKQTAGTAIGVRTSRSATVEALRPFLQDRDLRIEFRYDVSAALALSAGAAFRIELVDVGPPSGPIDYYYLVEYKKGPPDAINLYAVIGGAANLLGSAPAAAATGTLAVQVEGVNPTRIQVFHNLGASPVIDVADTTYNFGGWRAGIASYDPAGLSRDEQWDDFVVRRNTDVFAVVQYPPGEDAALPGERSPTALPYRGVLFSTDGTTFTPAAADPYCVEAPNGFVQIQAEDRTNDGDDNVFRVEYKIDKLTLTCPTCLTTLNGCPANPSPYDATAPVLETGKPVDLAAYWWNEHAADIDPIRLQAYVFLGNCFESLPVASGAMTALSPSPATAGGARHLTTAAPLLSWVPAAAGLHCVVVLEQYDLNRDGCPDGFEGAGCTPTFNPDQNFATQGILVNVEVFPPCTPIAVSNLSGNSLRATKDLVTAGQTWIEWSLVDPTQFPAQYNVHATEDKVALQSAATLPIWREIVGRTRETVALPDPAPGGVEHVVVYQNDGCESQRSLADP